MLVVGLSGYKQAGKDSVADILVRDYGFTKMAFADPIKEMVRDLDPMVGWSTDSCCAECFDQPEPIYLSDLYSYGWTEQMIKDSEYGDEVRRIWQRFGTEVFRAEDKDFWVNKAAESLAAGASDRVVFTDVRFENEADFIYTLRHDGWYDAKAGLMLEASASVWRIHRDSDGPRDVHESEQMIGMLGEEVTILNKGTLKDLEEPVAIAMDMLLKGDYPGDMLFGPASFKSE